MSYVRRLAQARLDLIEAEMHRRDSSQDPKIVTSELPAILGSHLTGGPARPPRPAEDASSHPLALELDRLSARLGASDLNSLDDDELVALRSELRVFEQTRSRSGASSSTASTRSVPSSSAGIARARPTSKA